VKATTKEAYQLLHAGSIALAQVEANGIKIDVAYLNKSVEEAAQRIKDTQAKLMNSDVWKAWKKRFREKAKLGSRQQLGEVLFKLLKHPCPKKTATGLPSTDDSTLKTVDLPFVNDYLLLGDLQKDKSTYLEGIQKEVCGNYLHPSFSLNTVVSYRSCIAKGTLIEIVRDVSKHPKGIPIEDVKGGDYAYCYDDDLNLCIRKVLWAGKTGRRRVIRIHWLARGKRGYVDLTPEHKVRLLDGQYLAAKHLLSYRTLAMGRDLDRLWQTGTVPILDHRLVYKELVGPLRRKDVVHHKDHNHLNNVPDNLQKMSRANHGRHHAPDCLTDKARENAFKVRMENIQSGATIYASGEDHWGWLHLTKYQFLRILAKSSGKIAKTQHDFGIMKRKAELLGINLWNVKDRYDRNGLYISRGKIARELEANGRSGILKAFGINFYKIKRMLEQRGFSTKRRWANQFGKFKPNNHRIVSVEWIDKECDVYDIEVEEYHNFIANEICVHNSSQNPNFQNFPIRDPERGKLIRQCFIPRKGRVLVEIDYSGIEVKIAQCYHQDPVMFKYLTDPNSDMHRDMAVDCFLLGDAKEVTKQSRYVAKNQFVFPEFYGSYYVDTAAGLWNAIGSMKLVTTAGVPLKKHLARKGIKELGLCDPNKRPRPGTFEHHIKAVEDDFWGKRFSVYAKWKEQWFRAYQSKGYFDMLTGFRCKGLYKRNEVINLPVQGAAFHCLLWSLIQLQNYIIKKGLRTLIVGQIHDCLVLDVPMSEIQIILNAARRIMTKNLVREWRWITVPMGIEVDVTPEGGSWFDKAPWECEDDVWQAKVKK